MDCTYTIGVDLGGTNLRVAAYDGGTDFLEVIRASTPLERGRDEVVRTVCEAIEALASRGFGRCAGIGMGAPGPLELPEGIVRQPPNLPGWDGFRLREAIETRLGQSIKLENDANVAALAEAALGAGRRYNSDSLCMLTLGTGVGSGLVLHGRVWHGFSGMGGEAGHVIIEARNGAPCGCGGAGCLEQYASAPAVVRMRQERQGAGSVQTAHEVFLQACGGDSQAQAVFDTVGFSLAIGLTAMINTLNLPLYVLGGGVCEAWDLFAPTMLSELRRRSYVYRLTEPEASNAASLEYHRTRVVRAELGSAAGLLGACLLPMPDRQVPKRADQDVNGVARIEEGDPNTTRTNNLCDSGTKEPVTCR